MQTNIFKPLKTFLLGAVLFPAVAWADLPFEIVPDGTLPTEVSIGNPVSAAYEVSNNTRYARSDNFVRSLPPNVVLDPSVGNGDCGTTFDLAAKGSSGDSCILNLLVYGAVNANDPDPSNHLFVCMSDRTTCSGTAYPLNVTISDNPPPPPTHQLGTAVGTYVLNSTDTIAAPILRSTDSGLTWAVASSSAASSNPYLEGSTCSGSKCTAVGVMGSGTTVTGQNVSILNSSDAGATWTRVADVDIALPAGASTDSLMIELNGVVCVADVCTAVGLYTDSNNGNALTPLILNSANGGATWTGVEKIQVALPAEAIASSDVSLNAITCAAGEDDTVCTAVGQYLDMESSPASYMPLVLNSDDSGAAWTGVDPDDITLSLETGDNVTLNSVNCIGLACTAVGYVTAGDNTVTPLILNSIDGGETWSGEEILITLPTGAQDSDNIGLNSVSCTTAGCTAVGYYIDDNNDTLVLILNSDGTDTDTWTGAGLTITLPTAAADSMDISLSSVICLDTGCTATGYYALGDQLVNNAIYPLVLNSNGAKDTWTGVQASNISLPTETTYLGLNTVTCLNTVCIGAGVYEKTRQTVDILPLILNATDESDLTWETVPADEITLPTDGDGDQAVISSVVCAENDCTAVGNYPVDGLSSPLILNSDDAGETWTSENVEITLPTDGENVALRSVTCVGNTCTAAGYKGESEGMSAQTFNLVILNSSDRNTWESADNITLPSDYVELSIGEDLLDISVSNVSVSCTSATCTLVTTYVNEANESFPLILNSTDGGDNWLYTQDITLPSNQALDGEASTSFVTCTGNTCTAVGAYPVVKSASLLPISSPLILNSNDAGDSWTAIAANNIQLPEGLDGPAMLSSLSCAEETCISVGVYATGGQANPGGPGPGNHVGPGPGNPVSNPLILKSDDGGDNWVLATEIDLPISSGSAALNSVICTSDLCTAVGFYGLQTAPLSLLVAGPGPGPGQIRNLGLPLILNSTDGGDTWTLVGLDDMGLPDDFLSGMLLGEG